MRFGSRAFEGKMGDPVTFPPEPLVVYDLHAWFPEAQWNFSPALTAWMTAFETRVETLARIGKGFDVTEGMISVLPVDAKLRLYQTVGAVWLNTVSRGLLGDEMGVGKTVQALLAAEEKSQHVLISCPSYVKDHWAKHIRYWTHQSATIADGERPQRNAALAVNAKYVLINHEMLRPGQYPQLAARTWDVFIIDEAHRVHNRTALQSKGAKAIKAKRLFLLTGTPIWNKPDNLWHLLHLLDPLRFSSYWRFVEQFCLLNRTMYGIDIAGPNPQELERLQWTLIPYFLRRTKDEVLPDLPPKIYETITYSLSAAQRALYRDVKKRLELELASGEIKSYNALVAAMSDLRQICDHPSLVGANGDSGKDVAMKDLLDDVLASEEKVVIFCWHRKYVAHLKTLIRERYKLASAIVTGDTKPEARTELVRDFREGHVRVLIGTIASMGTGIDLYESATAIFAEMDWTPAMNVQAEDRLHRIGQKRSPTIYHIIGKQTIEEHILSVTQEKADIADQTLAINAVLEKIIHGTKDFT